jgi:CRP/FNR family transcriptional regulator, cyclic AMP receptor protein
MLAARPLEIVENCHDRSDRPLRKKSDVCSQIVSRLAALAIPVSLAKRASLFAEGEPSRGIFILYSGRVKLSTTSADGKCVILGFADPGEILGLAGTLSGQPYEARAEALQPTQAGFVERENLVHLMRHHGELALQLAMQLGESYCSAVARVRVMVQSRTASQKLATFLLDWCKSYCLFHDEAGARLTLTHEEIGQVIGLSRETVTRLLTGFKKKRLIRWTGGDLVLTDRGALQSSLGT